MDDLFGERHDPGGKSKSRLLPGVSGDAEFCGPGDIYRPILRRWAGDRFPAEFVLFVGMNPSVAGADFNDPTVAREWAFTAAWGFTGMAKVNVADYRMTDPSRLADVRVPLASDRNLGTILASAVKASKIVMVHGNLPKPLRPFGQQVTTVLREAGVELWCFARNGDGSPKHSLYVRGDTVLMPY